MIAPVAITEGVQAYLLNKEHHLRHAYQRFFPDQYMRVLKKDTILNVRDDDNGLVPAGAVIFSDLRHFTTIAEKMKNSLDVLNFIRSYLKSFPILQESCGIVDKYIGDAIMIVYPSDIEMALIEAKTLVSSEVYSTGVGIGFGDYTVGVVGQRNNLNISVFGSCVNEASRLCNFVKVVDAKILMSAPYYNALSSETQKSCRYIGRFTMRGRIEPTEIYECWEALPTERRQLAINGAELLQEAIVYYQRDDREACLQVLDAIDTHGRDGVVKYYRSLCWQSERSARPFDILDRSA